MGFDFRRNVSRALKDKQLGRNFKFAMGNFILKRQQVFPDENETERPFFIDPSINSDDAI
jgi:hypothetical protein